MLALNYLAAHDIEQRREDAIDLKTALEAFENGCYSAMRGHNVNIKDANDKDKPRCVEGQFVALVNSLQFIHRACKVETLTHEMVMTELPGEVFKVLGNYLDELQESNETLLGEALNALESTVYDTEFMLYKYPEIIWEKLEEKVSIHLIEKYGAVYGGDENHKSFRQLILHSVYFTNKPDLSRWNKTGDVSYKTNSGEGTMMLKQPEVV